MTRRMDDRPRPARAKCRVCKAVFQVASLPCAWEVWCLALKGARCPVCGANPQDLFMADRPSPPSR
jgi:hypothetical protein